MEKRRRKRPFSMSFGNFAGYTANVNRTCREVWDADLEVWRCLWRALSLPAFSPDHWIHDYLFIANCCELSMNGMNRFMAVTRPIKYAKHKSNNRVALTIGIVWIISLGIGSPIVFGLNTSPERIPELCIFYNSDFIIYSSLGSFYIPCCLMVFLYYKIFKAIRKRAKRQIGSAAGSHKPTQSDSTKIQPKVPHMPASQQPKSSTPDALVIENISLTTRLKEEAESENLVSGTSPSSSIAASANQAKLKERAKKKLSLITEAEAITVGASGSQGEEEDDDDDEDEDDEDDSEPEAVECHVIKNRQTSECEINVIRVSERDSRSRYDPSAYRLSEEIRLEESRSGKVKSSGQGTHFGSSAKSGVAVNGNPDSGYAPSNVEETHSGYLRNTDSASPASVLDPSELRSHLHPIEPSISSDPLTRGTTTISSSTSNGERHVTTEHEKQLLEKVTPESGLAISISPIPGVPPSSTAESAETQPPDPEAGEAIAPSSSKKKKARFNLGRKHKSSRKKREKASAKRERKATKTLAIVLGKHITRHQAPHHHIIWHLLLLLLFLLSYSLIFSINNLLFTCPFWTSRDPFPSIFLPGLSAMRRVIAVSGRWKKTLFQFLHPGRPFFFVSSVA